MEGGELHDVFFKLWCFFISRTLPTLGLNENINPHTVYQIDQEGGEVQVKSILFQRK